MSYGHDEGPIYYREIQKNAYLKRIPNEPSGNKLLPLGHKKPPLKPMWTQFCVHNGRAPYLEQYPLAESPATMSHKPVWRACLQTARHVTASVKPHVGKEYDFLVDTDEGPVRMLAPDWESMQDWVQTLRTKLHELRVLSAGENVYCSPPAPPAPRAAARDPTSPLPPTPPHPPDRVPGIELTTPAVARPDPLPEPATPPEVLPPPQPEIDISSWEDTPSTSQDQPELRSETTTKSVAKICGQNICLDDSILKRNTEPTDSDEELFSEIDRISDSVDNMDFDYKQTLVVTDRQTTEESKQSEPQATNVTVIQVSNKGPPHTAIPILGPETDIFDFNFQNPSTFINIVNTEVNLNNEQNGYGTVFGKESDYGHISLTTTVNVTRQETTPAVTVTDVKVTPVRTDTNGVYERLCLASTSNETPVDRVRGVERERKSSLPNLDRNEMAYECLFPSESSRNAVVTVNSERREANSDRREVNSDRREVNSDRREVNYDRREVNSDRRDVNNDRSERSPVVANFSSNSRVLRSNVERSHSQNAYDASPRTRENLCRRVQNNSPKREVKTDKSDTSQPKPIWKRGLTELSLLTRLRGIGQGKRHESPTRQEAEPIDRSVTSPVKVVHRSRPEARADNTRRRSSSLNNGNTTGGGLIPLRRRQALALQADQARRAAIPTTAPAHSPPLFVDYMDQIWIAWWPSYGSRCSGRTGDRLTSVRCTTPIDARHANTLIHQPHAPRVCQLDTLVSHLDSVVAFLRFPLLRANGRPADVGPLYHSHRRASRKHAYTPATRAQAWWPSYGSRCSGRTGDRLTSVRCTTPIDARHANTLIHQPHAPRVDILFQRVPLGKIFVINKRDQESIGIKLDNECNIVNVERNSPAARSGLPPAGAWAITEVNNRPLNLLKGGDEELQRISLHGTEVSVLLQPSALVKKMRAAIKANKTLWSKR